MRSFTKRSHTFLCIKENNENKAHFHLEINWTDDYCWPLLDEMSECLLYNSIQPEIEEWSSWDEEAPTSIKIEGGNGIVPPPQDEDEEEEPDYFKDMAPTIRKTQKVGWLLGGWLCYICCRFIVIYLFLSIFCHNFLFIFSYSYIFYVFTS